MREAQVMIWVHSSRRFRVSRRELELRRFALDAVVRMLRSRGHSTVGSFQFDTYVEIATIAVPWFLKWKESRRQVSMVEVANKFG